MCARGLINHYLMVAPGAVNSLELPTCPSLRQRSGSQMALWQTVVGAPPPPPLHGLCGQSRWAGYQRFQLLNMWLLLRPPHLSQWHPHPLMLRLKTLESSLTLLSHPTSKPSANPVGFPLKYMRNLTFPLVLTALT